VTRYKLSNEAKTDLARIYWHGVERFGISQADQYLDALIRRFDEISETPHKYPAVDHIREGYRRSVCGVHTIYYRVDNEIIKIMRILGRQDIPGSL
jgi:toxin ParE1/3/4